MRLLVTGGNGFIATNFIKLALEAHDIVSIDNMSYSGAGDNHTIYQNANNYKFIHEDIRNESLENIIYEAAQVNKDTEHRLFFVGVTRAKNKLYIMNQDSEYQYNIGEDL